MLTRRAYTHFGIVLTIASVWALASASAASKEYENFNLPSTGGKAAVPETALNYHSQRVQITSKNVRLHEPSVNHKEFLFAKEVFLAEKRDEAIKLLRQDLDSGLRANRDNILLRLGQLYAEKYMELSYNETGLYSEQLREWEKQKAVDKNASKPVADTSRSQRYLKDALGLFYSLEREYPHHPKIDEVIFFIGFVEMESGNVKKGSSYLERVVRQYPRSRKYDEAVVYLADNYFDNHRFREAYGKYRILLARKDSPLYHYALYKMAWCELNTGAQRQALNDMKGLIQSLEGTTDKAKFNLREQAIKDLVVFYGEVGAVDEAYAYFETAVGKQKALENLRLIADILRSKAQDEEAIKAYSHLLSEYGDSPESLKLQLGLYESLARMGRSDQAVEHLVKAIEHYGPNSEWAKAQPPEKVAEIKSTMNDLGNEAEKVALFYHHAAQKSSNKASYQLALRLYSVILQNFPDHPDRKKIAFYRAEILFDQGKWREAADSYMETAKVPPKDKMTDESVYNALLALDRLTAKQETLERYSKEEQKTVDQTPQEIGSDEKRFIEVAEYYLREYPKGDRVVDVRFRIAAIYYHYHHFDESLAMFKEIALQHPKHRSAVTAARIVLDIYNMKKDYASMDVNAGVFAHTEGLGDAAFRKEMADLSGQISFKSVEKLEADNKWKDAGESYLAFYKKNPNGDLAEKALYNAYVSFDKANDTARASEASHLFIAKYPKSPYTQKMMLSNAKFAEKQYDFELAQRLFYDYYKKFPKDKEARKALYNSALFAELLEMNKTAISLYDDYLRDRSVPDKERKAIVISEAKLYRKDGDWEKMALMYRRLIYRSQSTAEKLDLMGELARQYEKGGKIAEKETVVNQIRWTASSQNAQLKGLAAQYVAEVRFRALAKKRQKYDEVKLRFPPEDLLFLLKKKEKLLGKLASDYDSVVNDGVPEWGVAALLEKSEAYDNFVKSFREMQIPAKYTGDARKETEADLKALDTKLVKPLETKAQEILKVCVDKAAEFHVSNEYSDKCRERIKKSGNEAEPTGLLPKPTYWSTRSANEGVARP